MSMDIRNRDGQQVDEHGTASRTKNGSSSSSRRGIVDSNAGDGGGTLAHDRASSSIRTRSTGGGCKPSTSVAVSSGNSWDSSAWRVPVVSGLKDGSLQSAWDLPTPALASVAISSSRLRKPPAGSNGSGTSRSSNSSKASHKQQQQQQPAPQPHKSNKGLELPSGQKMSRAPTATTTDGGDRWSRLATPTARRRADYVLPPTSEETSAGNFVGSVAQRVLQKQTVQRTPTKPVVGQDRFSWQTNSGGGTASSLFRQPKPSQIDGSAANSRRRLKVGAGQGGTGGLGRKSVNRNHAIRQMTQRSHDSAFIRGGGGALRPVSPADGDENNGNDNGNDTGNASATFEEMASSLLDLWSQELSTSDGVKGGDTGAGA